MKKPVNNICSNCGKDNPLFEKNCRNCKHYLRASVINIDLWSTIWQLFESPKQAHVRIIQADHKNFVSFILVFIALKFFLYSVFVQSLLDLPIKNSQNIGTNLLLLLGIYVVIIFIFIRIKTSIINRWRVSRYKDNLSLFSYSFVPIIFSLFILTPVEYGIFGVHWFIFNPSPFIIKEFLAYVLAFVEIMMVIWSIFLYFSAVKIQSNSVSTAIIFTCSLLSILTAALLLIPHVII